MIIYVDREPAADFADRLEAFLCDRSAQTQCERYGDTNVRVLATLD